MPEDQVEMLWRCGDKGCDNENKGRHKKCARCGRPKTEEDGYYMPGDISHSAAVTDEKELQHAKGGADWFCRFCGTRQFRADKICDNCGVDQAQGAKVEEPPAKWVEPVVRRAVKASMLRHIFNRYQPLFVIGGPFVALIIFFVWVFRPKIVDATVTSSTWHTVVHVDLYSKHWHDGFDLPEDAVDVSFEGQRIHHYDHVIAGHHDEPYNHHYVCGQACRDVPKSCRTTPRSCRSNKNGYATCTGGDRVCTGGGRSCVDKYCDETLHRLVDDYLDIPRFRDHYSWNQWEWAHERDLPQQGTDTTPIYAEPILRDDDSGQKERVASKEETNDVVFTQGKETWMYHPATGELPQLVVGTRKRIKVTLGSVEILK